MTLRPTQESAGRLEKYRVAKASPQVCNLYSLHKKREMLARFFRVSHNRSVVFEPLPAVFPGHVAPVVREDADGERQIVLMSWGFVLLQKIERRGASPTSGMTRSSRAGFGAAH